MRKVEIQYDLKPNGAVIRINNFRGCILRICGIPEHLVFDENGDVREFVDLAFPQIPVNKKLESILPFDTSNKDSEGKVIVATLPNGGNIVATPEVIELMLKNMDINSKSGTKVKLSMKDGEVFGGYESDKEQALKYLVPDTIYHVKRTDVQDWTTDVYLEEFPSIGFNSVMFEYVKD